MVRSSLKGLEESHRAVECEVNGLFLVKMIHLVIQREQKGVQVMQCVHASHIFNQLRLALAVDHLGNVCCRTVTWGIRVRQKCSAAEARLIHTSTLHHSAAHLVAGQSYAQGRRLFNHRFMKYRN